MSSFGALVDREREMAELDECLLAAQRGAGLSLVISGTAGADMMLLR